MSDINSLICSQNTLPILVLSGFQLDNFVKGYHAYQEFWVPTVGEFISARRQEENPVDRFAVTVTKQGRVIGRHSKKGASGRFSKLISYFLKDKYSSCRVVIQGNRVNLGDGEGLQVPRRLLVD